MTSKNSYTSSRKTSQPPKPNTSTDTYHLTPSEIESLRKDKKELTEYLKKKYYPGVRTI